MHHKLVIFGASSGGEKVYYTLKSIGIDVEFFVDNDANKWGQTFHNRLIKSPEELIEQDIRIVIAAKEFTKIDAIRSIIAIKYILHSFIDGFTLLTIFTFCIFKIIVITIRAYTKLAA